MSGTSFVVAPIPDHAAFEQAVFQGQLSDDLFNSPVSRCVSFTSGELACRAVAESVVEPGKYVRRPDVTLAMSGETWAKLYLSQVTPENMMRTETSRSPATPSCASDKSVRSVLAGEGRRHSAKRAGSPATSASVNLAQLDSLVLCDS